jgi:ribosomal protein S18 acetylase RimI-like enzyme
MTAAAERTGPPVVRRATVDDASAIAEVRVTTWRAAYAGIVPQAVLDRMDVDRATQRTAALLASGEDPRIHVVEGSGGRVVGYAFTAPARDEDAAGLGEIQAIYVRPDAQGAGLGGALLAAAAGDLEDRGFSTLVLWVLTDNGPARGFYEHEGFAPDGAARDLDFDGEAIEEIRYRR